MPLSKLSRLKARLTGRPELFASLERLQSQLLLLQLARVGGGSNLIPAKGALPLTQRPWPRYGARLSLNPAPGAVQELKLQEVLALRTHSSRVFSAQFRLYTIIRLPHTV